MRKKQEQIFHILIIMVTLVMMILRFLLNEKGRVSPDSIRFMRFANVFPVIDNTVTPIGYPLSIKFFTFFGVDEFWSSKVVGILAYLFIIYFAWKKKFYFREVIYTCALFSFVSIFTYTMSEALILPFVFIFLYVSRNIIIGVYKNWKALFYLALLLILLYNIRYSALFFIGACFLFGLLHYKKKYGKTFLFSGIIGLFFVVLYKFIFIDYFNENYIQDSLNFSLHPTSKLLVEFFQGITTSFNPFIHISSPSGGFVNIAIFGIGFVNILLMIFIFIKNGLSETEFFFVFTGVAGILCSYFIQYFYSVNPIDYRLLAPFTFPIWLVYFKKIFPIFGTLTYALPVFSILVGGLFIFLSCANYLENRKNVIFYLKSKNLNHNRIDFYIKNESNLKEIQMAEIISTVNPKLYLTKKPEDTLKKSTLTLHKVLSKIKIQENRFQ